MTITNHLITCKGVPYNNIQYELLLYYLYNVSDDINEEIEKHSFPNKVDLEQLPFPLVPQLDYNQTGGGLNRFRRFWLNCFPNTLGQVNSVTPGKLKMA